MTVLLRRFGEKTQELGTFAAQRLPLFKVLTYSLDMFACWMFFWEQKQPYLGSHEVLSHFFIAIRCNKYG